MIKITIDEKELKSVKEARKHLDTLSESVETMKKEIDRLLSWATAGTGEQPNAKKIKVPIALKDTNGYNPELTWRQKAKYVLEKSPEPITTGRIADTILTLEPGLDRKRVVSTISSILSPNVIPEWIVRSTNERGEAIFAMNRQ